MPGLDEFYRYIERKEKEATEPALERAPVPEPGTDDHLRYVVRNGLTIAIPVDSIESDDEVLTLRPESPQAELPLDLPAPKPVLRPTLKIPNPKQVVEQPFIPPLPPAKPGTDSEAAALWEGLPRHVQILAAMAPTEVPPERSFEETRDQLISRLLDPVLTLEETAKLLDVCPATVRRYANRGHLQHHRTLGQQRRFKLSDVLAFLDKRAAKQRHTAA